MDLPESERTHMQALIAVNVDIDMAKRQLAQLQDQKLAYVHQHYTQLWVIQCTPTDIVDDTDLTQTCIQPQKHVVGLYTTEAYAKHMLGNVTTSQCKLCTWTYCIESVDVTKVPVYEILEHLNRPINTIFDKFPYNDLDL